MAQTMSLDKAILHKKEKRKPFRGPKAFDPACRSKTCPACRSNATYANRKRLLSANSKESVMEGDEKLYAGHVNGY
jgi:hypothetical protein